MARTVVTGKTLSVNPTIRGTEGMIVPKGTTAQRPSTPAEGIIRYNDTTGKFEGYSKDPNNTSSAIWTSIGGGNILDLGDVNENGLQNRDVLAYDSDNQNFVPVRQGFSKVKVAGQSDILTTSTSDLEIEAGTGITLTSDSVNNKLTITSTSTTLAADSFTADGNTKNFTLSNTPAAAIQLLVFVDNLYQPPNSYSVVGNSLQFDENIPIGIVVNVTFLNLETQITTVADGSITSAKVANSAFHVDTLYGTGSGTTFRLSQRASTPNQLFVSVNDVMKQPGKDNDYYLENTTTTSDIVFNIPPVFNAIIKVRFLGITTGAPQAVPANSVNIQELGTSDGNAGQVLSTDGAGTLSFVDNNNFDVIYNNVTYQNPGTLEFDVASGFQISETSTGNLKATFQERFEKIEIAGQPTVTADSLNKFVLKAGGGITFTTNNTTKEIEVSSSLGSITNMIPALDNTYDLGSNSVTWKDLYVKSIKLGSITISDTSSSGGTFVVPNTLKLGSTNSVTINASTNGLEIPKIALGTPAQISANEHVTLEATAGKLNIPANNIGIAELNVSDGNNGQVLTTNGAGVLSFGDALTSIIAGSGLSGGTITSTGTISLSSATQTMIDQGVIAYNRSTHESAGYLTAITQFPLGTLSNVNYGTLGASKDEFALVYDHDTTSFILKNLNILWSNNGNDTFYNSGKVGIGVMNPLAMLHIDNQTTNHSFKITDGTTANLLYAAKGESVLTQRPFHIETDVSTTIPQPTTGGKIYFKNGLPYYVSSSRTETPMGGTIAELGDTTYTNIANNHILKYDGNGWVNVELQSAITFPANSTYSLQGLSDTATDSASSGQVLEYDGTKWVGSPVSTTITRYSQVAGANDTTFAFSYAIGNIDVFVNGVKLNSTDYTATDGQNVVLSSPTKASDVVEITNYGLKQLSPNTIYFRQEFSGFAGTETYVDLNQAYQQGYVDCYKNGIKLRTDEFTASAQQSPWRITLASGTFQSSDKFEVIAYRTVNFADTTYAIYTRESIVATGGETSVNSSHSLYLNHFELFLNGVKLNTTDYSLLTNNITITLTFTLSSGDTLEILGFKPRQANETQVFATDTLNVTSTVNTMSLTNTPPSIESIIVIKDGSILLAGTDYSLSGSTLTFVSNLTNGNKVTVRHIQVSNSNNSTPGPGQVAGQQMASIVDGDYTLIPYQYQNDDTISTVSTYGAANKNTALVGPLTMSEQVTIAGVVTVI